MQSCHVRHLTAINAPSGGTGHHVLQLARLDGGPITM
jgi:hypothetical protein